MSSRAWCLSGVVRASKQQDVYPLLSLYLVRVFRFLSVFSRGCSSDSGMGDSAVRGSRRVVLTTLGGRGEESSLLDRWKCFRALVALSLFIPGLWLDVSRNVFFRRYAFCVRGKTFVWSSYGSWPCACYSTGSGSLLPLKQRAATASSVRGELPVPLAVVVDPVGSRAPIFSPLSPGVGNQGNASHHAVGAVWS